VPAKVLVSDTEVVAPEQIVWEAGVAVATGMGLTVIITVSGVPEQPLAEGVIVYVAVPAVMPVVLRLWAMAEPEDAVAPETPDCTTVHEKVVPATLLVRDIVVAVPEHRVCNAGVAVMTGMGLTVITTTLGVPAQPLAVGVTV
jgi:hypothetical protein